jgi:hypothetical protein
MVVRRPPGTKIGQWRMTRGGSATYLKVPFEWKDKMPGEDDGFAARALVERGCR